MNNKLIKIFTVTLSLVCLVPSLTAMGSGEKKETGSRKRKALSNSPAQKLIEIVKTALNEIPKTSLNKIKAIKFTKIEEIKTLIDTELLPKIVEIISAHGEDFRSIEGLESHQIQGLLTNRAFTGGLRACIDSWILKNIPNAQSIVLAETIANKSVEALAECLYKTLSRAKISSTEKSTEKNTSTPASQSSSASSQATAAPVKIISAQSSSSTLQQPTPIRPLLADRLSPVARPLTSSKTEKSGTRQSTAKTKANNSSQRANIRSSSTALSPINLRPRRTPRHTPSTTPSSSSISPNKNPLFDTADTFVGGDYDALPDKTKDSRILPTAARQRLTKNQKNKATEELSKEEKIKAKHQAVIDAYNTDPKKDKEEPSKEIREEINNDLEEIQARMTSEYDQQESESDDEDHIEQRNQQRISYTEHQTNEKEPKDSTKFEPSLNVWDLGIKFAETMDPGMRTLCDAMRYHEIPCSPKNPSQKSIQAARDLMGIYSPQAESSSVQEQSDEEFDSSSDEGSDEELSDDEELSNQNNQPGEISEINQRSISPFPMGTTSNLPPMIPLLPRFIPLPISLPAFPTMNLLGAQDQQLASASASSSSMSSSAQASATIEQPVLHLIDPSTAPSLSSSMQAIPQSQPQPSSSSSLSSSAEPPMAMEQSSTQSVEPDSSTSYSLTYLTGPEIRFVKSCTIQELENRLKSDKTYARAHEGLIHAAVSLKNKDSAKKIKLLLQAGADINAKAKGITPLSRAISSVVTTEILKQLLDAGASLFLRDDDGTYPIHIAIEKHKKQLVPIMLDHHNNNETLKNQLLTLQNPKGQTTQELIEQDLSNPTAQPSSSSSKSGVVRYRKNKSKEVHFTSPESQFIRSCTLKELQDKLESDKTYAKVHKDLLHATISTQNQYPVEKIDLLVKAGANPNVKAKGITPLSRAISSSSFVSPKILKKLLDAGASLFLQDDDRTYPIHTAIEKHNKQLVQIMLDHHNNNEALKNQLLTLQNPDGQTTQELINQHLKDEIIITAIQPSSSSSISASAQAPMAMEQSNTQSMSVPAMAASASSAPSSQALLNMGAANPSSTQAPQDINAKDANGFTRLHHAASQGKIEEVINLLAQGADINATNNSGSTPLMVADYGALDVIRLLLIKGADVRKLNRFNLTAYDQILIVLQQLGQQQAYEHQTITNDRNNLNAIKALFTQNHADITGNEVLAERQQSSSASASSSSMSSSAQPPMAMEQSNTQSMSVPATAASASSAPSSLAPFSMGVANPYASALSQSTQAAISTSQETAIPASENSSERFDTEEAAMYNSQQAQEQNLSMSMAEAEQNAFGTEQSNGQMMMSSSSPFGDFDSTNENEPELSEQDQSQLTHEEPVAQENSQEASAVAQTRIAPVASYSSSSSSLVTAAIAPATESVTSTSAESASSSSGTLSTPAPMAMGQSNPLSLSVPAMAASTNSVTSSQAPFSMGAANPSSAQAPQDINAKDANGFTLLHHAASQGKIEEVINLLAQGADINATDNSGSTPLMVANYGALDVIRLLLTKGADVRKLNRFNLTAYDHVLTAYDRVLYELQKLGQQQPYEHQTITNARNNLNVIKALFTQNHANITGNEVLAERQQSSSASASSSSGTLSIPAPMTIEQPAWHFMNLLPTAPNLSSSMQATPQSQPQPSSSSSMSPFPELSMTMEQSNTQSVEPDSLTSYSRAYLRGPEIRFVNSCTVQQLEDKLKSDPKYATAHEGLMHAAAASPVNCGLTDPVKKIELLVKAGVNCNTKAKGITALSRAISWNSGPSVIQKLLDCGADPCIPDDNGIYPIHVAIDKRRDQEIRIMLNHNNGAYKNDLLTRRNHKGETTAQLINQHLKGKGIIPAAQPSSSSSMSSSAQTPATVEQPTWRFMNPSTAPNLSSLMQAIPQSQPQPQPSSSSSGTLSALPPMTMGQSNAQHMAPRLSGPEIKFVRTCTLQELKDKLESDSTYATRHNGLIHAAVSVKKAKDAVKKIELLVGAGADINAKAKGTTPLSRASSSVVSPEILKELLDRGANLFLRNDDNTLPIHIAIEKRNASAVKAMLNHNNGAQKNALLAEQNRDRQTTEQLINLYLKDKEIIPVTSSSSSSSGTLSAQAPMTIGQPALHFMNPPIAPNLSSSMQAIPQSQPQPQPSSSSSALPLMTMGQSNTLSMSAPAAMAAFTGSANSTQAPLNMGIANPSSAQAPQDINAVDANGFTRLHLAAAQGKIEEVRNLVAAGGNVNAKDSKGITPLHTAIIGGHSEIVRLLISKGANVYATYYSSTLGKAVNAYDRISYDLNTLGQPQSNENPAITNTRNKYLAMKDLLAHYQDNTERDDDRAPRISFDSNAANPYASVLSQSTQAANSASTEESEMESSQQAQEQYVSMSIAEAEQNAFGTEQANGQMMMSSSSPFGDFNSTNENEPELSEQDQSQLTHEQQVTEESIPEDHVLLSAIDNNNPEQVAELLEDESVAQLLQGQTGETLISRAQALTNSYSSSNAQNNNLNIIDMLERTRRNMQAADSASQETDTTTGTNPSELSDTEESEMGSSQPVQEQQEAHATTQPSIPEAWLTFVEEVVNEVCIKTLHDNNKTTDVQVLAAIRNQLRELYPTLGQLNDREAFIGRIMNILENNLISSGSNNAGDFKAGLAYTLRKLLKRDDIISKIQALLLGFKLKAAAEFFGLKRKPFDDQDGAAGLALSLQKIMNPESSYSWSNLKNSAVRFGTSALISLGMHALHEKTRKGMLFTSAPAA